MRALSKAFGAVALAVTLAVEITFVDSDRSTLLGSKLGPAPLLSLGVGVSVEVSRGVVGRLGGLVDPSASARGWPNFVTATIPPAMSAAATIATRTASRARRLRPCLAWGSTGASASTGVVSCSTTGCGAGTGGEIGVAGGAGLGIAATTGVAVIGGA